MKTSQLLRSDDESIDTPAPSAPLAKVHSLKPFLQLKNVCKSYGEGKAKTSVLKNINLDIEAGEFIAIVGFSGSGKTTLISTIAGLIEADSGEVLKQGWPIKGPGPDRCVVFQNYSLLPWLTVFDNVALAVDQRFKDWPADRRKAHTEKYVRMVNLGAAMTKKPAELSGGMRQRVNVARALAADPDILLLDEPLSALDALTRGKLQDEIIAIWQAEKKTVILITNDVDEAIYMADRVIALNPGPGATFGPNFKIPLARPRDRAALNHDETFKKLRAEITRYLMGVGMQKAESGSDAVVLPDVRPNTSNDWKLDNSALKPRQNDLGKPRYLEFSQLSKIYPTPDGKSTVKVVDGFDMLVKKGEFISIIGHSGCGKSTVLSMTAGLTDVSEGGIVLDNKEIDSAGPDKGVVFQSPSLFPWLTAFENVMIGVDNVYPHASQSERDDIVEYYLTRVGLADAMEKKAADLSNGMRQRVGIARAFALSPKLLLLDEPFGMLDSLTRWELQEVLMEVWERTHVTAIVVTHDVDEAILLADRVVMMTNGPHAKIGKIETIDLPRPRTRQALLDHPDYYKYRESLLTFLAECDHTH
ncbi:ABC transporter ATP-binding protein [Methylotuvimicrobium alcaliphilum]|uniref:Nitrate ABC transporter, ATPase subunits C and D n=1 Tax=Methylotuvimicrobium alcaliphilum (strain DSM 19304 / NCIMB 14124 / VKM B-2133 / 20Z) TaxID=1091494 RepID=G4SU59_META2|nr:nitrate ABC transporter ATP-binding protein [Methylotuvimicrobium alcaliphilum]CCE23965.1 Nitrate ABC transporter, ATPase subunits C and D [Methylotuvimicrobium alcaliphilum 20Z]